MAEYTHAHFDDPSICQALDTDIKNYESIAQFLHYLQSALSWGAVKPNQTCVATLLTIANSELPPSAPNPEWDWDFILQKDNKNVAQ